MLTTADVMAGKMLVQLGLADGEEVRALLREVDGDPSRERDLVHRLVERQRLGRDQVQLIRHRTALYEHVRREAVYLRFLERCMAVDKGVVADLIARLERAAYRRRLGEALIQMGRLEAEQDRTMTAQMWDWLAKDDERILDKYRREGFAGVKRPLIPGSRLEPEEFKISTLFRGQETRVLVKKAELESLRAALEGSPIVGGAAPQPPSAASAPPPAPPPPPTEAAPAVVRKRRPREAGPATPAPPPGDDAPTFHQPPPARPARRPLSLEEVTQLRRIGEFEVVEMLGQGGMGAVFLGQASTGEYLAIKVLLDQLAGDLARQRFLREIDLLRRVKHPNVIHVIDSGVTEDGLTYLAIPALPGKELREHVEKAGGHGLPAEVVLRVYEQVLQGMSAVHAQKIVHRDLKPENVFVLAGGKWDVRIMDFGLAKLGSDAEGVVPPAFNSATDEVAGSPAYLAPESVTNDTIDARTDIYSLGIMLFELFSGRLPLESETAQGFLGQHMICPPLTLAEARPERPWPAPLEALLARMLGKTREERPASCDEVLAQLRAMREEVLAAERSAPAAQATPVTLPPASSDDGSGKGRWRGLIGKLLGS